MIAKIKHRVRLEDHTKLETIIPLSTPLVLIVDPASTCNLQCRFCPTGNRDLIRSTNRYQGPMGLNVFEKILADLNEFPDSLRVLRLYKEGEPLMNTNFAEMVAMAKGSEKILRIDTTTNGVLLNPEKIEKIINAGIDRINISVNGMNTKQIFQFTRVHIDFCRYIENIKYLYQNRGHCEIYIKAIKENLTPDDQSRFLDTFGSLADLVYLESLSPAWPDFTFEGVQEHFETGNYGQAIYERLVCPNIFYTMVINSDGSVSSCVADWPHKNVFANIQNESVSKIWNSESLNQFRIQHLKGLRKENSLCSNCQVMSHGTLEDIDQSAPVLLEKMLRKAGPSK